MDSPTEPTSFVHKGLVMDFVHQIKALLQAAVDALSDLSPGGARMVGSRSVCFRVSWSGKASKTRVTESVPLNGQIPCRQFLKPCLGKTQQENF